MTGTRVHDQPESVFIFTGIRKLANRAGSGGLLSFSVHPGGIRTELGRHLTPELMNDMVAFARG